MLSKRSVLRFLAVGTLAVGISVGFTACGLKVGEPSPDSSGFGFGDTACMRGGSQTMVDFLQGRADLERVTSLWNCADQSLELFEERTRGKTAPGKYTDQELRNFMKNYFKTEISDGLLAEFMILKRTLVGGAGDGVTVAELEQVRAIFRTLREQSVKLNPYMPFTAEHFAVLDENSVRAGVQALEEAAREVGKLLKAQNHAYAFRHLETLLTEFERGASSGESAEAIRAFRSHLPLLRKLKALVISPNAEEISGAEWEELLVNSSRWAGAYLRFAYVQANYPSYVFMKNGQPSARAKLMGIGRDVLELLEQSIAKRPDQVVPFKEINALIDELSPSAFRFGDKQVTPENVKTFIPIFVRRVLGGAVAGPDGRDAPGLTPAGLRRGFALLEEWSESQRYIDALFQRVSSQGGLSGKERRAFTQEELLAPSIPDLIHADGEPEVPVTLSAASRVRILISTSHAFFREEGEELYFGPPGEAPVFSYHGLSQLNYMDILGHLMVSSYAEDLTRARSHILLPEVEQFYRDAKDLGVELKIFDPNGVNVALKRFQESDLFMFDSNGDGAMNVAEATQILAFMISAKRITQRVLPVLARICAERTKQELPVDFFGFQKIDAKCYRDVMLEKYDQVWLNMPLLSLYFRKLNADMRAEFLRNLEDSSRVGGASDRAIDSADSDTMAGMAQYIEAFFARYDTDESNTIDLKEAITGPNPAFPVFKEALAKAAKDDGLTSEKDLKVLFSYLLAYGKVPTGPGFLWWKIKGEGRWEFEADRGRMIRILAELAKKIRTGTPMKANFRTMAELGPQVLNMASQIDGVSP